MTDRQHLQRHVTISQFAQLSGLSPKALRMYGERGLFVPAWVDDENGYRYYDLQQLPAARLVAALRGGGMSLAAVERVLDALRDGSARRHIEAAKLTLDVEHDLRQALLNDALVLAGQLEQRITDEGETMKDRVTTETQPERIVISTTARLRASDLPRHIGSEAGRLAQYAEQHGATWATQLTMYHGEVDNEGKDGPVEVCLVVDRDLPADGDITCRVIPEVTVARCVATFREAEFPTVLGAYDAIIEWARDRGSDIAGSPWEECLAHPEAIGPNDDFLAVTWPIEPAPVAAG
jgi:DNA-binding transcriptional MerR regulator